jgi:hypothetical protein
MITIKNAINYKETLIKSIKRGETHVFYFEYENNPKIKGFYALENQSNVFISVCAISSILKENIYEKLRSKYFDIDNTYQKQFFLIEEIKDLDENLKSLIDIISSNTKKGTPRKHIVVDGEKINISLETRTINEDYFKTK